MYNKFVMVALLTLAPGAWAQGLQGLTEADVVKLALERNEVSAITKNQIEQAEHRLKKSRSYLFPTLKANASIQKFYILPEKRLPGGMRIDGAEFTLNQPLYTFGRLSSGIRMAELDKEMTINTAKATVGEIQKAAKALFYNAAFNKYLLEIAQDSLKNANNNKRALEERVQFGRINQNDNIKMQADVATREPLLYEAQKGYQAALEDLGYFLDTDVASIKDINSKSLDIAIKTFEEKSATGLVDVKNAAKQVELAAAQESVAKKDYLPTVSAFASYMPKHTNLGASIPGVLLIDTFVMGVRMDMEIPIGGAKTYEKREKVLAKVNADLNLRRVTREVTKKQKSFIQQYGHLADKGKSLKRAITLADRSYKVALASFKNGNVSQLQLNDTEMQLTSNKISYAQNLLAMKMIELDLERLQIQGN